MSTACLIFPSVIMKTAFCVHKLNIFVNPREEIKIDCAPQWWLCFVGKISFFMLVCVFASALADPSFRDVYLSECDIWLNQDWSDTRKMSGEQPELGKCHRVEAARSAAVPFTRSHVSMDTHITFVTVWVDVHVGEILQWCVHWWIGRMINKHIHA